MRYLPTLVILDIHVPGSSGLSTLRKLKEHPLTEDIPVIILTSDASGKNAAKAYKYKASAFMNKPVDMERIHEVIDTGWSWPEDNIPQ